MVNGQAQDFGQRQTLVAGASSSVIRVQVFDLNQLPACLKLFIIRGKNSLP
jgi:hypothetical protein